MTRISGIMTAAAAAVLLSISPVAAQNDAASGAGKGTGAEVQPRPFLNEDARIDVFDAFGGMEVTPTDVSPDWTVGARMPAGMTTEPIPAQIVEVEPSLEGYHYFGTADGRIAVVDPDTNVIVDILEAL